MIQGQDINQTLTFLRFDSLGHACLFIFNQRGGYLMTIQGYTFFKIPRNSIPFQQTNRPSIKISLSSYYAAFPSFWVCGCPSERRIKRWFNLREAVSSSLKGNPRLAWGLEEKRRTLEQGRRRTRTLEASLVLLPRRGRSAQDRCWVWSLGAAHAMSVRRCPICAG